MTKSNKEIVLEVLKRSFIDRDPTVVEQYFGANYKQHNPVIPDGPSAIAEMIPTLTALRYEPGMAVAEGDLIEFDIPKRTISVAVTDAELRRRLSTWQAPAPRYTSGVMAKYAFMVSSASQGAVTTPSLLSGHSTPEAAHARTL